MKGKEKVGTLVGSVDSICPSGFFLKSMGERDVFSKKKETRAGLHRIILPYTGLLYRTWFINFF